VKWLACEERNLSSLARLFLLSLACHPETIRRGWLKELNFHTTGHAKQLIAIRIAPRLFAQLRRLASKQSKPYQTLIHELLERATKKVA
jgi:hypothetical protein